MSKGFCQSIHIPAISNLNIHRMKEALFSFCLACILQQARAQQFSLLKHTNGTLAGGDAYHLSGAGDSIFLSADGVNGTIADQSNILPLGIAEFNGKLINDDGVLNWKTADNLNAEEFLVQRSLDGTRYSSIGQVAAIKTGDDHQYMVVDTGVTRLGVEMIYYRLKQIDKYGYHIYSRIIAMPVGKMPRTTLYPNPARETINLLVAALRNGRLNYRICDNNGRVMLFAARQLSIGKNDFPIDITKLPAGNYYLLLQDSSGERQIRFLRH